MSLITLSVNGPGPGAGPGPRSSLSPGSGPESVLGREDVIMMRLQTLILKDDERKETTNRVLSHWSRDEILVSKPSEPEVSVRLPPGSKFPVYQLTSTHEHWDTEQRREI